MNFTVLGMLPHLAKTHMHAPSSSILEHFFQLSTPNHANPPRRPSPTFCIRNITKGKDDHASKEPPSDPVVVQEANDVLDRSPIFDSPMICRH